MPDRLTDPGEHFPYKHEVVRELVDFDPPMGPEGPDDDRVTAADFMSHDIADASNAYVQAQEAYLISPAAGTRADYEATKAGLVDARRAHRTNRAGLGLTALAKRA